MEFSRIGEHTIKCTITEQEIESLGFTIDDVLSNSERTQEFMNHIFDLAEKEFQMKFELGIKTVRADFMSDHTLALTFSEHPVNGMMEHLKDIIGGLIGSMANAAMGSSLLGSSDKSAGQNQKQEIMPEDKKTDTVLVLALFTFDSMEILSAFAKQVDLAPLPESTLYKWENKYILSANLSDYNESEVLRLSTLTDEYASGIQVGVQRNAFYKEHAKCILKEHAIEQLQLL